MAFSSIASSLGGVGGVVVAVVVGIVLVDVLFSRRYKNLPPGPWGLPILGHMHLLGPYPHRDLAKLAETHGPLMTLRFGKQLTVVASNAAAAKEILNTQDLNFSNRMRISFGELVLPNDIVFPNDTPERNHLKKILHNTLSTTKSLQLSESVRAEEIAHVLSVMPQDGRTVVPVRTYTEVMVTNILSRMCLKKRFAAVATHFPLAGEVQGKELQQVRKFRMLVEEIAAESFHMDLGDFIPVIKKLDLLGFRKRLRNLKKRMDVFMGGVISEHREQRRIKSILPSEKDMVDVLLDQMEDENARFDIHDEHISGLLWNAFIGGSSTTIDAVEWILSESIRNPKIMSKVQAEIDSVVGKARRVQETDIPNLKYLQAMVKETFRLHITPILFPHVNNSACKVFGYDIPAGTTAFICIGAIAKDPSVWEDPLEYKPERFLDGAPHAATDVMGAHFELLTFGSGRRGCPGKELATTSVHIIVATLLQCFDWALPDGVAPETLDMAEGPGRLHKRANQLMAIPKTRSLSIS